MRFRKKLSVLSLVSSLLFVHPLVIDEIIAQGSHLIEIEEEEVEENLELPDIYENTIIYNGTINPELSLWVELPWHEPSAGPGEEPEGLETPYVNDVGQFSMTFTTEDLEAGDEITFAFGAAESEPYRHTIEVQTAEEGMEIVESSADTSEVQNAVREATEINWLEGNATPAFELRTVGDIDNLPFYSVMEQPISLETRIEHSDQNLYRANFSVDSINIGDTITIYIVASGVTTTIETEVPDNLVALSSDDGEQGEEIDDPEESENSDTDDEDPEDQNDGEDDESDNDDEENLDEVDPPETEGAEDEEEGLSTGWIIAGAVLVLTVIGGVMYAVKKKNQ